jgi:uncharacterized protein (TIGR03435 family)
MMSHLTVPSHPLFVALMQHLWQTTLFAAAIWMLTAMMRSNRAQTRFRLWLLASVKFLLPLSLLITAGQHLRPARSQATAPIAFTMVMQGTPNDAAVAVATGAAVATPAAAIATTEAKPFDVTLLLAIVWAVGAVGLLALWLRRWAVVRSAVRNGTRAATIDGIPAITTTAPLEPGVFGILRPVLVLPSGIHERLTPVEMRGILAHELSHVRRRDNLTATIHMLVQAVFWFHPMVWVIGARMLQEREAACDAAVLEAQVEAETYAEGILKICRMYVEAPVPCVAGVTGADLKQRVVRILSGDVGRQLSAARKLALTTLSIAAVGAPILFGILHVTKLQAAEPRTAVAAAFHAVMEAPVAFETTTPKLRLPQALPPPAEPAPHLSPEPIAIDKGGAILDISIQRSNPYQPGMGFGADGLSGTGPSNFRTMNTTVADLIAFAYEVQAKQIIDGPRWIDSERYDVFAKLSPRPFSRGALLPVLRKLLADRFGVKLRVARRDLPVYVLSVAKEGHSLRQDERNPNGLPGFGLMGPGNMAVTNATMPEFCAGIQRFAPDRPFVDHTGLKGRWYFDLQWRPDAIYYSAMHMQTPRNPPEDRSPPMLTAIREQLGLAVEPTTTPMNVLVLERVSKPKVD